MGQRIEKVFEGGGRYLELDDYPSSRKAELEVDSPNGSFFLRFVNHGIAQGGESSNSFDVSVYPIENGKPNIAQLLKDLNVDAAEWDLEEMASQFAGRLMMGIPVKDLFLDYEEQISAKSLRKA